MDLLDRNTSQARILETNLDCYVTDRTQVVSWSVKCLTVSFFVMINLLMAFACILYGYSKGEKWQTLWMISALGTVAVEILFNNVTEAIIINFAIPETIFAEAVSAKKLLSRVIRNVCQGKAFIANPAVDSDDDSSIAAFSACELLFVSTRIARKMPHLMESKIILSYCDSIPMHVDSSRTEEVQNLVDSKEGSSSSPSSSILEKFWKILCFPCTCVASLLVITLKYMGVINLELQRALVHTAQPVALVFIALPFSLIQSNAVLAVSVVVVVMTAFISVWILHFRGQKRSQQRTSSRHDVAGRLTMVRHTMASRGSVVLSQEELDEINNPMAFDTLEHSVFSDDI